jgi:hypothetical protein
MINTSMFNTSVSSINAFNSEFASRGPGHPCSTLYLEQDFYTLSNNLAFKCVIDSVQAYDQFFYDLSAALHLIMVRSREGFHDANFKLSIMIAFNFATRENKSLKWPVEYLSEAKNVVDVDLQINDTLNQMEDFTGICGQIPDNVLNKLFIKSDRLSSLNGIPALAVSDFRNQHPAEILGINGKLTNLTTSGYFSYKKKVQTFWFNTSKLSSFEGIRFNDNGNDTVISICHSGTGLTSLKGLRPDVKITKLDLVESSIQSIDTKCNVYQLVLSPQQFDLSLSAHEIYHRDPDHREIETVSYCAESEIKNEKLYFNLATYTAKNLKELGLAFKSKNDPFEFQEFLIKFSTP